MGGREKMAGNAERTYVMVKPDGVQRGLVAEVIKRFSQRGYKLCGLKMLMVERSHAEKHYADISSKPFFNDLVDYIISGPVVAWSGRVRTPSRPAASSSGPPTPWPPSPGPSAGTSASRLASGSPRVSASTPPP